MIHRKRNEQRAFTVMETVAALAVLSVVMVLVITLLAFARRGGKAALETRLAASIAQGAFERARGVESNVMPTTDIPLPPEAARLAEAKVTATVSPWTGEPGVRHVRVVLAWRSSRGVARETVREGLVSVTP